MPRDEGNERAKRAATIRWLGDGAAIVWIFGGATYFLVHFSQVFYMANKSSIDAAASGLSRMLGLDGMEL